MVAHHESIGRKRSTDLADSNNKQEEESQISTDGQYILIAIYFISVVGLILTIIMAH